MGGSGMMRCGGKGCKLRHLVRFGGAAAIPKFRNIIACQAGRSRSRIAGAVMSKPGYARRTLLAGASLVAIVIWSSDARAGGIGIREQSAVGQGMSFAGAGTPGMGLSAMFWNPAAVTQARGLWSETHTTFLIPHGVITAGSGTANPPLFGLGASSGNIGELAFIPTSYVAYRIDPNWYFGLSMSAPFGAGTEAHVPWAGQNYAIQARVKSTDINAILGWKINELLSVAAGPRLLYLFDGKFSRATSPALTPSISALRSLDDLGYGFSAGITYTPTPATEIALGYRSRVKLNIDGKVSLPTGVPFGPGVYGVTSGETLPDQVNFGVRQRMTDRLTLLGTVEWTDWSVLQNVPFTFTNGPAAGATVSTLTFNYRDGWLVALGGEYQWSPQTTLRAGIAYEHSPVTDRIRDTSLPDDNRWWFSVGLTQQWSARTTIDLGYSFVYLGHSPIDIVPGHPDFASVGAPLVAHSNSYNHIVSLAWRYKWTDDR